MSRSNAMLKCENAYNVKMGGSPLTQQEIYHGCWASRSDW